MNEFEHYNVTVIAEVEEHYGFPFTQLFNTSNRQRYPRLKCVNCGKECSYAVMGFYNCDPHRILCYDCQESNKGKKYGSTSTTDSTARSKPVG